MKISLTQNKYALVDDEDYEYLSQWNWYYNDGYACRKKDGKHFRMHQEIMGRAWIDHINGDTLDNRKSNLRLANHSTNAMNMRKHKGKSVYKGVSKAKGQWRVQIWKDSEKVFSAMAKKERWAGMIYDLNAPALFGEFARPNFPNALGSEVKTAGELHE